MIQVCNRQGMKICSRQYTILRPLHRMDDRIPPLHHTSLSRMEARGGQCPNGGTAGADGSRVTAWFDSPVDPAPPHGRREPCCGRKNSRQGDGGHRPFGQLVHESSYICLSEFINMFWQVNHGQLRKKNSIREVLFFEKSLVTSLIFGYANI